MPAASINSAPGTILGHVQAIRAAHHRLTGRILSWETAIGQLDRFNAAQDDPTLPVKTRDVVIGCWLTEVSYSPAAINRILAHVAIFGSAHGAPDIDADDAEAVDAIMPTRQAEVRDSYAAHYFLGA